jgi:sulfur carrier protein ThiS
VTIRVFGSKLNDEPSEEFAVGGMTVREWLAKNIQSYSDMEVHPISVSLNGEVIPSERWAMCSFAATDTVDIVIEPKGTELFFGALFLVAIKTLTPKIPKVSSTAQNGEDLNEASIKGNKVKLNSPIREIAGTRKVYPDYLLPPRRYFAGPREQHVEMLLCIGKGEHEVPGNKILVGDTPTISLGADVEVNVYQPGDDLSADPARLWWNDVTEVGSSSNGSSGLELTVATPLTNGYVATSQIFDDYTVTIPSGAGLFPSDWGDDLIVRILVSYQYEFADGGGSRDIIRGFNLDMLAPSVGDTIEIAGTNAGLYVVNSFTPSAGAVPAEMTLNFDGGAPVTGLTLGSLPASIAPRGQRFRITVFSASQITVERLDSTGAVDTDFPGFIYLETASASVTLDPSNLEGGYRGPFAMCPDGDLATAIEWDVFMPSGLCGLGREGQVYEVGAFHTFEYRDMDIAGAWTVIEKSHYGSSLDSQGFTNRIDLPYPMRPEARVKKRFIQQNERETEINNDTVWYGARSLLSSPASYDGVTIMSVNARGGDRLSAQSESMISVEATRKLPTRLNGAWTAPIATRDIAPFFAYVAKNVGYTDADIDLVELDRLDAIWKARGDHYNQATNTNGTAKGVINDALGCGFSELTVDRGLLRPARDEPRVAFESMYTPQNMTESLERNFTAVRPDDYDGVDVEYVDGVSWQVETVECRLPGDAGARVQKVKAEGCTNRTKAWQIGMRQRRALKYRRWEYSWSTELDALNSRYLSYVQVADDVPGYAQSAQMVSYDDGVIESSEAFDWSDPPPHYVYVRRQDGSSAGPYVATQIDDFHLSISGLDFPPDTSLDREPPHLLFGVGYKVLITSISPNGTDSASVEAMAYNELVYASDDLTPP